MGSDATSSSSTTTGTQGTTQATDDGSGTGPSTADSTGTGSAETGTTGETTATGTTGSCQPITEDASAIGDDCSDMPCPAEYTCWEISAFQLQQLCEIICEQDCECPQGHTCEMMEDKVKQWMQCNPI